ncbi:hypothetical protein NBRC116585_25860 [Thalassolituus maritimus]|uniref:Uncharacterized protein n=1 Tax=Thalassolituus maritimus TaxID=484498 RepID=A0ABQ0A247_9GAMM
MKVVRDKTAVNATLTTEKDRFGVIGALLNLIAMIIIVITTIKLHSREVMNLYRGDILYKHGYFKENGEDEQWQKVNN